MADVLSKQVKMFKLDASGLVIDRGSGPYYSQIPTPSLPADFHYIIGFSWDAGWDEHVRTYVLSNTIGFACDTKRTLGQGRRLNVFYI